MGNREGAYHTAAQTRRGLTLVELLVVLVIVVVVSAVTLPVLVGAFRERHVVSAASLVQASILAARDDTVAAMSWRPGEERRALTEEEALHGIRLVPESVTRLADGTVDPSRTLLCSRIAKLEIPQTYQTGKASIYPRDVYPATVTGGRRCLVLEQSPGHWEPTPDGFAWLANEPTSWAWNLRVGERVSVDSGFKYAICGPMVVGFDGNPEGFINYGPAGSRTGLTRTYPSPDGQSITVEIEYLLLVNGQDDNGWDGLDNDFDRVADELDEWKEQEVWIGKQLEGATDTLYRVIRRPVENGTAATLPNPAVIDLTGWGTTAGRSRVIVNRFSGAVDLLVDRSGKVIHDLPYGARSTIPMVATFTHLWIGSREDQTQAVSPMPAPKEDARLLTINRSGNVSVQEISPDNVQKAYLDARRGVR